MKMYSLCTPSHQILVDEWFLPTIPRNINLVMERRSQECPSGEYWHRGWMKTISKKVDLIIRAIKENNGKMIIYSDVDVQFFGDIVPSIEIALQHNEIAFMRDNPYGTVCAGFFACRCNKNTLDLWKRVNRLCKLFRIDDQRALNHIIRREKTLCWKYLPPTFFGGGSLTYRRWNGNTCLLIPEGILIHHANWSISMNDKIAQLEQVKDIVAHWEKDERIGIAQLTQESPLLKRTKPFGLFERLWLRI